MIIEIPRGYTFVKDKSIIAFEEKGILKIYGRRGKFQKEIISTRILEY